MGTGSAGGRVSLWHIVRVSHTETTGLSQVGRGGEARGVAIRVDARVGSNWGVEAESAMASEVEDKCRPDILSLGLSTSAWFEQQLSTRVSVNYNERLRPSPPVPQYV
jgi:hypothetical protein